MNKETFEALKRVVWFLNEYVVGKENYVMKTDKNVKQLEAWIDEVVFL